MLPPFIIEQIRKREQDERARHEQPRLEIHPDPPRRIPRVEESEPAAERGVVILELR
jgi:hypothetical protein